MSFDSRAFRDSLASFATGICVVTCLDQDGDPQGITINSFSSVSLEPPLILFSLDRLSNAFSYFIDADSFAVNVLADDQSDLSRLFSFQSKDRWASVSYETWETGCPILNGSLATLECDVYDRHQGGDHVIFVGKVRNLISRRDGAPLIYFRSRYSVLRAE